MDFTQAAAAALAIFHQCPHQNSSKLRILRLPKFRQVTDNSGLSGEQAQITCNNLKSGSVEVRL
jgi:hypothetical protein